MSGRAEWMSGVRAITEEAAGLLTVEIIRCDDMPGLIALALVGDPDASRAVHAVQRTLMVIRNAPRRSPTLCSCCPRPIRKGVGFALVLAVPERSDPSHFLGLAVCEKCASTTGEIREKATGALRKLWPDLRPVDVTHRHGGRA